MPLSYQFVSTLTALKDEYGGYDPLAKRIAQATAGRQTVDRRKLKELIEGGTRSALSLDQFEALDAFLVASGHGDGLVNRPLLTRETLMSSLVERGRVALVVGARPRGRDYRHDVSIWDVRALARLMAALQKERPNIALDLQEALSPDVPAARIREWLGRVEAGRRPRPLTPDLRADALNDLLGDDGPSVCCVGSPRSCYLAEIMLARMFGVGPFRAPALLPAGPAVPFSFIWPPGKELESSFALSRDQVTGLYPKVFGRDPARWWGFRWKDEAISVRNGKADMGVIAAQRRPRGQVWLVLGGVSGPGTFAAAVAAAGIAAEPRPGEAGRPGPPLYAAVEAAVRDRPAKRPGDPRDVKEKSIRLLWPG